MRILMLGNSFTFANGMPETLAEMLGARVVHRTRGGAHLSEQMNPDTELGAGTLAALRDEEWDYVVLQEYSTGPVKRPERFFDSVRRLCGRIRENGAQPVLFATWAFRRGGRRLAESGLGYDDMFTALHDAYTRAGEMSGASIADVGSRFYELAGERDLYADDGCHPSPEGSRIAAEAIAETIRRLEAARPEK